MFTTVVEQERKQKVADAAAASPVSGAEETAEEAKTSVLTGRMRRALTPFILRRTKADVLQHLPPKTHAIGHCVMSSTQQAIYSTIVASLRNQLSCLARPLTEADKKPVFVASLNSYTTAGDDVASNMLMLLRKAANHPLLIRHRFTDDDVLRIAREHHGPPYPPQVPKIQVIEPEPVVLSEVGRPSRRAAQRAAVAMKTSAEAQTGEFDEASSESETEAKAPVAATASKKRKRDEKPAATATPITAFFRGSKAATTAASSDTAIDLTAEKPASEADAEAEGDATAKTKELDVSFDVPCPGGWEEFLAWAHGDEELADLAQVCRETSIHTFGQRRLGPVRPPAPPMLWSLTSLRLPCLSANFAVSVVRI